MKKVTLFIVCIVKLITIQAQTYKSFPTKNATWVNQYGTVNFNSGMDWELPVHYCMGVADTIIHSVTYSKINYCGGAYHGALRDDKGKIYYVPADSLNELLIYDFTLKNGDSVSVYSIQGGKNTFPFKKNKYDHVQVDSILIKGAYRKRIQLNGFQWVEGIGNTRGLFVESWVNVSGWGTRLLCMSENDTTLFPSVTPGKCSLTIGVNESSKTSAITLFPNPTNEKFQLLTENASVRTAEVMDVLGKTIYTFSPKDKVIEIDISTLLPGIYFVRLTDLGGNVFLKKILKE